MKTVKKLFVIGFFISLPFYSGAWGVLGHRVVGGIADNHLSARAKAQVKKLLGHQPIAMASNWADFIKSDRAFDYIGPWHYINLHPGMSETALYEYLKADTSTNLYTKLNFLVTELKRKKIPVEKQGFYLKLLIHLVGDAHQPMHTGRPTDKGGNSIKLYWFNTPTNLHRVWDEHLVEFQQLSYSEHVAALDTAGAAHIREWQKQPMSQWIHESYVLAEKLYRGIKADQRLRYEYNFRYVDMMNQQLLKGGIRLAALLNEIYSTQPA